VERIGPDLFRLTSGGFAAPHLVMGDVPTLIDAGTAGRGPAIERELQAAGIRIGRIILTHGDPDHAGGSDHLRRVTGAEVMAAEAERPLLDRSGWPSLPRFRRTLLPLLYRGVPPPTIDRWVEGATAIGGIEVIPAPGHTPGHIVLGWQGWLLAGDALISGPRFRESPRLLTVDRPMARRSIEALLSRCPIGLSSSHGKPAERGTERLQMLVDSWQ
jgi:glyoxylase-like metal-dependent hydrolase (beta-lactamase superfamily II)